MAGITDSVVYRVFVHPEMLAHLPVLQPDEGSGIVMMSPDTLHVNGRFLTHGGIEMVEKTHIVMQNDWMIWSLLFLSFALSVIWFYFPEQLSEISLFYGKKSFTGKRRIKGNFIQGIITKGLLALNFWFTISLFVFLATHLFFPDFFSGSNSKINLIIIAGAVIFLYFYRYFFIVVAAFLFKTPDAARQQIKLYLNTDNVTGMIFIPLLLLMLIFDIKILMFTGIILIISIHIFRWFQTFLLSKKVSGFSTLHLFMYLCTLEIIPFLILIKVFKQMYV